MGIHWLYNQREVTHTPVDSGKQSLTHDILERCRKMGFALAGVAEAKPTSHGRELRAWLAEGRHGEMHYLQRYADVLADPQQVLKGARSIICVADRYADGTPDPPLIPGHGRIARYARGDDYHNVIKKRLHALCDELAKRFPVESFRACVDTAPVLEREYSARAGLGAIGKHTLLIEKGIGSYLLLGEVLTTLDLEPTGPGEDTAIDPCGTCTRCIDACPTNAISPWSIDATRCISYLTIEHRSPIAEQFHEPMAAAGWLFGCDICQEVCPHNQPTERQKTSGRNEAYSPRNGRSDLNLADVVRWSEDERRASVRGSAMKRAKLDMLQRNARILLRDVPVDASTKK